MRRKLILLVIITFSVFPVFSQDCGSKLPANYAALRSQYLQIAAMSNTLLPHDTCLNKKLSVVFYVFLDSLGQPGVTAAQYAACINILNKYFKPICLQFMNCSTKFIPEYEYNKWDRPNHENKIVGSSYNYFTEKTINIYLVSQMIVPPKAGYAYGPGGRDLIVMLKSAFTGMTAVHEMGHFFGLPHTFAEISTSSEDGPSTELVNGSNCTLRGDGFCDTDADPYSIGSGTGPCGYVYGPKDANNQYYVPPVDNIMSYWACRCRFTQEQFNWMAYMYANFRNYLH